MFELLEVHEDSLLNANFVLLFVTHINTRVELVDVGEQLVVVAESVGIQCIQTFFRDHVQLFALAGLGDDSRIELLRLLGGSLQECARDLKVG